MSISISNTILTNDIETTNKGDVEDRIPDIKASANIIHRHIDTYSSLLESAYSAPLAAGLDVVREAAKSIPLIQNPSVKKQAIRVLDLIQRRLELLSRCSVLFNRLPKLHLSISDDQSSLLEWNFANFRIGFTLEPEEDKSSFYLMSQDKEMGTFSATSSKLEKDEHEKIDAIVDYVVGNT